MDDDRVGLLFDCAEDEFLAEADAGDDMPDFGIRVALGVNEEAGMAVVFEGFRIGRTFVHDETVK